jgi:hypothetical protein
MKLATIDLKGKAYATVPTRIKEFREACPNGLIETKPETQPDGQVMFTARILSDKSNPNSAEAIGHSIGKLSGDKSFEKLETISIGRALAILGYMASGEIASTEEMESFNDYKNEKKLEAVAKMNAVTTLQELKDTYMSLGSMMGDTDIITLKDHLKTNLK